MGRTEAMTVDATDRKVTTRPPIADKSLPSYVANPREGEEVAARLGLEILCELGEGAAGAAFLLEDGRVLKVTSSMPEATVAGMLMDRQVDSKAAHGFPRIDQVVAMDTSVEVNGVDYAIRSYAIVREEVADIVNDGPGGNDLMYWAFAMDVVGRARALKTAMDFGPAAYCAPHAEAVYDAIAWAARDLGVAIDDIRSSNLGVVEGKLVVRDFAPDTLPDRLLDRASSIPTIPERVAAKAGHAISR